MGQSTYTGATNGEWGTAANWSGGVPNAIGATVNINTPIVLRSRVEDSFALF
jgi:hypothetical protein